MTVNLVGTTVTDSQVTDANGNFLFTRLPDENCDVSVDATTATPDVEVGVCPVSFNVGLGVGESFLDADFCFVELN